MASYIDYYYTPVSPFAFFGHDTLMEITQKLRRHSRRPVTGNPDVSFYGWTHFATLAKKE